MTTIHPSTVGGTITAPASKSSMQRAIACALLADGRSLIRNPAWCADSRAALSLACDLGAKAEILPEGLAVTGSPAFRFGRGQAPGQVGGADAAAPGRAGPSAEGGTRSVSCGESGLCIRMFTPVAALLPGETILTGRGSLAKRPVSMMESPLRALGAGCSSADGLPPVTVRGPLPGGFARVDGSESSQFLTGLLVALPLAGTDSLVEVDSLASRGYVDLTLDTMRGFGVDVPGDPAYRSFAIRGGRRYSACDFTVEGDWSSAAFLVAAAALASGGRALEIRGLQRGSSQPDKAILRAAALAGARVRDSGDKPGDAQVSGPGDTAGHAPCLASGHAAGRAPGGMSDDAVVVSGGRLEGFSFDATDCPDLFPPLVALAAHCAGVSEFRGAGRLRHKESDRASVLAREFGKLGVRIEVEGDVMRVHGGTLRGGRVDACGDHRIAMAAAVAALAAPAPVSIDGEDCVEKSWPEFFRDLASITGR